LGLTNLIGPLSTALISDRIGPVWTTVIAFFTRVAVFGLFVIDQSTPFVGGSSPSSATNYFTLV
jgi:hypothetical protein